MEKGLSACRCNSAIQPLGSVPTSRANFQHDLSGTLNLMCEELQQISEVCQLQQNKSKSIPMLLKYCSSNNKLPCPSQCNFKRFMISYKISCIEPDTLLILGWECLEVTILSGRQLTSGLTIQLYVILFIYANQMSHFSHK